MPAGPNRILVVCTRRLGDVLLATPLIRSLRHAYPDAVIDALVFAPTAPVLAGNPDLRRVIAWPQKQSAMAAWRGARPLFRAYDLAVAVTNSDRAHYFAAWAAPRRAAVITAGDRWKRWLMQCTVPLESAELHTVVQALRLVEALGLPPVPEVVPPQPADMQALDDRLGADWRKQPYAVVHPAPMFAYKAWTEAGWRSLIAALLARGLRVALSGGPDPAERAYVANLRAAIPASEGAVVDLSGRLAFAQLTPLLRGASVYLGPDTSVTHLAAACGTQTVMLSGPSNPLTWGPWPQGWAGTAGSPWQKFAPLQRQNNVCIVQGTEGRHAGCIPCLLEGCERHIGSTSDCLIALPASRVIAAVDQMLGAARAPA